MMSFARPMIVTIRKPLKPPQSALRLLERNCWWQRVISSPSFVGKIYLIVRNVINFSALMLYGLANVQRGSVRSWTSQIKRTFVLSLVPLPWWAFSLLLLFRFGFLMSNRFNLLQRSEVG